MTRVLYIGPDVVGRYPGGIMQIYKHYCSFANQYFTQFSLFFLNSHPLKHSKNSEGKLKMQNFIQAIFLFIRLNRYLIKNDIKLIHFNSSYSYPLLKDLIILFLIKIKFPKVKILIHIHFSGLNETFVKIGILRKVQIQLLKSFDGVIVLSNSFLRELLSIGFLEHKLFMLENFHINEKLKNSKIIRSQDCLNLLFIGSISHRKGFDILLRSLVDLPFAYNLNVLGQFEDQLFKKECIEYIFENSLNVHFHGFKSGIDKEFYLDLSSVLILVSRNEGFPMVIPEAFSYGLVTIATRIAAIPEIIISNYNGLLTDLEDISGLVKSLIFLHSSPVEFNRISENALNSSKLYSFKAHCNKLESFYLKFIDE